MQSLILHLKQAFGIASELRRIRAENPTCRIQNCRLHKVTFGSHSAVLDGVIAEDVRLGSFSYVSTHSRLVNVTTGKFCSIGPEVTIGLSPHPTRSFVSTSPVFYAADNISCPFPLRKDTIFESSVPETIIGHDVWIGSHVIIPGGITIGSGACIAAGSVVVKDVPAYAIVGGNPAALIRYRFPEEEIKVLLEAEWWDWPIDKIGRHIDTFSDIRKFMAMSGSEMNSAGRNNEG